jgi:hypothetical protein
MLLRYLSKLVILFFSLARTVLHNVLLLTTLIALFLGSLRLCFRLGLGNGGLVSLLLGFLLLPFSCLGCIQHIGKFRHGRVPKGIHRFLRLGPGGVLGSTRSWTG